MTPVDKNSEPLDAILRRAMRARPGPATPECADADAIAAYSDRSLSVHERERLDTHFADCARCQLLLADMARADESARIAKSAAGVPWYRRWRLTIPAIAVAAALLVFISLRRSAQVEAPNDQLVATAQQEIPAADLAAKQQPLPAPVPAAAPSAPVSVAAAAPSNEIAMNEPKPEAAPRAQAMGAMREMKKSAEAPGQATGTSGGSASNAGAQPLAESDAAPLPAAPAAAPPAQALNGRAEAFGSSGRGMAAGGAVGAIAGAAVGAPVAANPSGSSTSATLVTVSAPDRSVSWIAGKNGMISRRDADGSTHPQQSGASTDLVAGAAPSATVCWFVGRSGTIVRTTDGEHWTLITAPTADNLTAVTATDANDATITTSAGQSFTTSDGGASWHPQ